MPTFYDLSKPPEWATAKGTQPPGPADAKPTPKPESITADMTTKVVDALKSDALGFVRAGRLALGLDKPESAEDYVLMTAATIPALFAGGSGAAAALPQLGRFAAPLGRMAVEGLMSIPGAIKEGSVMEPLKRMAGAGIAEGTMGAGRWGLGKLAEPSTRMAEGVKEIAAKVPNAMTQPASPWEQSFLQSAAGASRLSPKQQRIMKGITAKTGPMLGDAPVTVEEAARMVSDMKPPMRDAAIKQAMAALNRTDPSGTLGRIFRDSVAPGHVLHLGGHGPGGLRLGALSPTGPVARTASALGKGMASPAGSIGQAGLDVLAGAEPLAAATVPIGIASFAAKHAPYGVRRMLPHDMDEGD